MTEPSGVVVLDASALLALLLEEPGADRVEAVLDRACIGAVNVSEVVGRLSDRGVPEPLLSRSLAELGLDVRPFDAEQAVQTGLLRPLTRSAGLSMGDRACLALAASLGAVALTGDQAWSTLTLDVAVELIR